jgi:FtsZ-binding cell division protein ZapB
MEVTEWKDKHEELSNLVQNQEDYIQTLRQDLKILSEQRHLWDMLSPLSIHQHDADSNYRTNMKESGA